MVAKAWFALIGAAACAINVSAGTAYPAYSQFGGKPYSVTYDKRAIQLNGDPVLFISGAIHPPRGTPAMWRTWMKEAVSNGLNMVQVYIFWNFHEQVEGVYNFNDRGNLTDFMQAAAEAGLFVNLRIGPYVCAEWTYGGLPAWLGQKPGVAFRQSNPIWQPAMEKWFNVIVKQMASGKFFATQGGPIVLVQVENELPKTDLTYVQWCGDMAHAALNAVGVNVPITMCNGETANNTINTCNGNDCSGYLEQHGQNGRVLVDQPGLWTENEGGFQTWGGAPPPGKEPYFWGRSMADQAMSVLKWFARGGSHMDYYMWTGGNNYGRWTGDGITHMYAVDAIVCPDGHRHEPKFSHTTQMHNAIATCADDIASNPAQLDQSQNLGKASAYVYGNCAFIEHGTSGTDTVSFKGHSYTLNGVTSLLVKLDSGTVLFDSGASSTATSHRVVTSAGSFTGFQQWPEPLIGADADTYYPSSSLFSASAPMEMTNITAALTTFAYYETTVPAAMSGGDKIDLPTYQSMAFEAFVDKTKFGEVEDHTHGNGAPKTLTISGNVMGRRESSEGTTLVLLAEELGYANFGFKEQVKKGLSGQPSINGKALASTWKMRGGLAGEHLALFTSTGTSKVSWTTSGQSTTAGVWLKTMFTTPANVADGPGATQLLLDASGLGRGRFWVNGHEVGRYYTLTRNDGSACPKGSSCPTQQYYHIPAAWLVSGQNANLLTIFEASGATELSSVGLATAQMATGAGPTVDPTKVVSCEM